MCTRRNKMMTLAALVLLGSISVGIAASEPSCICANPRERVGIYLAPLESSESGTGRLWVLLNLQIWATFEPKDNEHKCAMEENLHTSAPICSQLVLSGEVTRIGNDAVLEALLQRKPINDYRVDRPEIWTVSLLGKTVSFDPIKESYSFPPIIITSDEFKKYSHLRDVLICDKAELPCHGAKLGLGNAPVHITDAGSTAMVQSEATGQFTRVLANGRAGWLYLPYIGRRSEVIKFVAGVVRLLRGYYEDAALMFRGANDGTSNVGFRIDFFYCKRCQKNWLVSRAAKRYPKL